MRLPACSRGANDERDGYILLRSRAAQGCIPETDMMHLGGTTAGVSTRRPRIVL
jgi:hypothetical protein